MYCKECQQDYSYSIGQWHYKGRGEYVIVSEVLTVEIMCAMLIHAKELKLTEITYNRLYLDHKSCTGCFELSLKESKLIDMLLEKEADFLRAIYES